MRERRRIPPPPRKELSDNPVKLCCEISRLFHTRLRENAELDGVLSQPGARLVLTVLAINDGIIQKKLVDQTHLRAPTVSAILQKMEAEGMVVRREGENDRREVLVYLTDYGREKDREGIDKIKEYDRIALGGLEESEIDTLMKLLSKIRLNLNEMSDTNAENVAK